MDILVGGFSLLAVVFGLVEMLKKLGVSGNILILASVIVGVLVGVGQQLSVLYAAQVGPWFQLTVVGIVWGLVASGFYSFVNDRVPKA